MDNKESYNEMDENEKANYEQERADKNNAKIVSNAADVAIASKNPYAMAAGAIVKAGDAQTGGHMSETLGKVTTLANKNGGASVNSGKMLQKGMNELAESGAADKIGTAASIYSMGKGGGASGGAKAAEGASKAAGAANEASKAADAVNTAKNAEQAAKATGDATKVEEAKNATKAAESNAKEANKNAEEMQKRREAAQKTSSKTKVAKSTDKKSPYEEVKRKEDRSLDEIVEDKKAEKAEKDPADIKLGGEKLDKALDAVDVAVDTVNNFQEKEKKILKFVLITPIILTLFGVILIFTIIGSLFGTNIAPGSISDIGEETKETYIADYTYKYTDTLSIDLSEEDLIYGLAYYNLYDKIDTYINDNVNTEILYQVVGAIYTINIINTYQDSTIINYDDFTYCSIEGCYEITVDSKTIYVNEELAKDYTVSNEIDGINKDEKGKFKTGISDGVLIGELISEKNTNIKTVDNDLIDKIIGYINDGKTYEEILDKLGYNTKIDEDDLE